MKIPYIIAIPLLAVGLSVSHATNLRVTPGTLGTLLTDQVKTETTLTLTGQMDLRDFAALTEKMPTLKSLDLSGVNVTAYDLPRVPVSGPSSNMADELPDGALLGLHLTDLTLPSGLRAIGEGALAGGEFTTLVLPATLTTIGDNALYGCTRLESIVIPASVTTVGSYALGGCTALVSADLSATGLQEIPVRMFEGAAALASVSLPASLLSIGEGAFAGTTALKAVSLPSALTYIGKNAFNASGLEYVTVPASVTSVGDFAFSNCHSLTGATLGNPQATLGRGIFYSNPKFVTFEAQGIERFPDYLFAGNPETELASIVTDVSEIGAYALAGNGARYLTFGSTLVYLGDGAMENMTSLAEVNASALQSSVPGLGQDVFKGIDQPGVKLVVADNTSSIWNEAEQWREFRIFEVSQTDSEDMIPITDNNVRGHFDGTVLRLTSSEPMTYVDIYAPDGVKVAEATPHSTEASLETGGFQGRVYVVRAALDNGHIATLKLMR